VANNTFEIYVHCEIPDLLLRRHGIVILLNQSHEGHEQPPLKNDLP
jgi:hypothetical protein